eukprot:273510-Prorocentrum_minimum.AAC.1
MPTGRSGREPLGEGQQAFATTKRSMTTCSPVRTVSTETVARIAYASSLRHLVQNANAVNLLVVETKRGLSHCLCLRHLVQSAVNLLV